MSINIGDNFKFLGKRFLDDRESFATIAEMKSCENVPDGFITYCREDEKRYEFKSSNTINELTGKWTEFTININNNNNGNEGGSTEGGSGGGCDCEDIIIPEFECNCSYMGIEEPEDNEQIWFFDSTESESSGIEYDNPLISELFSYIQSLQNQIVQLQADVEYLKLNGGGGIPSEPEGGGSITGSSMFELEGGGFFELEDGSGYMILEQSSQSSSTTDSVLVLENEYDILLEDGGSILLEMNY